MNIWLKRILLSLLLIGALTAAGVIGYKIGFTHAALAADSNGSQFTYRFAEAHPMPFSHFGMEGHGFERPNMFRYQMDMFHNNRHNIGGSFIGSLFHLAVLGLLIWGVYNLFKGNGWTLSLTRNPTENKVETIPGTPKKKSGKSNV